MNLTRASGPIVGIAALAIGAATAGAVTIAKPDATAGQAAGPKPVLIETAITFPENAQPRGTIRRLFIGQRSPCTRARFEDEGTPAGIVKRIDCGRSGDLRIRFDPRPNARNQSSSWTLIAATGSFRGLEGGGSMFVRVEPRVRRGREVFTGTLR